MSEEDCDLKLTQEENELVVKLIEDQLKEIDEILLSKANSNFEKVAMIVAKAWDELKIFQGTPDVFYAQRVKKLVQEGHLEFQGNLDRMRFSEVRLPIE